MRLMRNVRQISPADNGIGTVGARLRANQED